MYALNLSGKSGKLFVAISLCIILCIYSVCEAQVTARVITPVADVPESVSVDIGVRGSSLLVSFNQTFPVPDDFSHWKIYYTTPFDPENYVWYKQKNYKYWEAVNEVGSPHGFSIHIETIPQFLIGRANIYVVAVDDDDNESPMSLANWNLNPEDIPEPGIGPMLGGFNEWNK